MPAVRESALVRAIASSPDSNVGMVVTAELRPPRADLGSAVKGFKKGMNDEEEEDKDKDAKQLRSEQPDAGTLKIGAVTIHDSQPSSALSVTQVVQRSSNVGVAKIALAMPREERHALFRRLGFGAPPQFGFPGEAGGRLRIVRPPALVARAFELTGLHEVLDLTDDRDQALAGR